EPQWSVWVSAMRVEFEDALREEVTLRNAPAANAQLFARVQEGLAANPTNHSISARLEEENQFSAYAYFAPRGIGLTASSSDTKKQTQTRRRFMLLGQTFNGMQSWDIRRAVQMIHFVREGDEARVALSASPTLDSSAR